MNNNYRGIMNLFKSNKFNYKILILKIKIQHYNMSAKNNKIKRTYKIYDKNQ